MAIYLILLLTDLLVWHLLLRAARDQKMWIRMAMGGTKALLSALLLLLIFITLPQRAAPDGQLPAFRRTELGTMAFLLFAQSVTLGAVALISLAAAALRSQKTRWHSPVTLLLFLLVTLLVADGYFRQRLSVRTIRREVTVAGLDPRLDGLKLVHISDLHLSSWYGHYGRLGRVMEDISREGPDLLFNTGDFITYGWQESAGCDTLLGKAGARYGAFAVEGNHDDGSYYLYNNRSNESNRHLNSSRSRKGGPGHDGDRSPGRGLPVDAAASRAEECRREMGRFIAASGYTLLRDSAVIIECRGTAMAVAGVETHGHRLNMSYGDFGSTLAEIPDTLFTILLLHDPDGWLRASAAGRMPQLTLSGHTHGFQVGLPGAAWSPSALLHKRWRGLYEHEGSQLFVTSGLGCMGMVLRIFMPPEIVILTLRAG